MIEKHRCAVCATSQKEPDSLVFVELLEDKRNSRGSHT